MSDQERIWTDEQVENLNAWQDCGYVHPFTWHDEEGNNTGAMIATPYGWVAKEGGPVVQTWAHDFMLSGESIKNIKEMYEKFGAKVDDHS